CHNEIRKASLVQLICPVRRKRVLLSFGAGSPTEQWHWRVRDAQARARMLSAWRVRAGNDLRVKGDQVNLSRMGGLAVAVGLATIAAGLVPATVARASAPGGGPAPTVTNYTGTPGVARLVPRTTRPAGCRPATSQRRRQCPPRRRPRL